MTLPLRTPAAISVAAVWDPAAAGMAVAAAVVRLQISIFCALDLTLAQCASCVCVHSCHLCGPRDAPLESDLFQKRPPPRVYREKQAPDSRLVWPFLEVSCPLLGSSSIHRRSVAWRLTCSGKL